MRASVFNWLTDRRIHAYRQHDSVDCGPTCLKIITNYYLKNIPIETLRQLSGISRDGVSLYGLNSAAKKIGFTTNPVLITAEDLVRNFEAPCIIHWNQKHFMVCHKITSNQSSVYFHMIDPAQGRCKFSMKEFRPLFETREDRGVVLYLKPNENFIEEKYKEKVKGWSILLPYTHKYKHLFIHISIYIIIASVLGFIFPILTQKIVDDGIVYRDKDFIGIVIIAQLGILISKYAVDFLRSWALLQVNTKINILFLSDFLRKITRLPIVFFETKNVGDIMQRIDDNSRIEKFLTEDSFFAVFSIINLITFSVLLCFYRPLFLLIFTIGNCLYITWVILFLKYRKELDNRKFAQLSGEQSKLLQLITGIAEIKINRSEKKEIWGWEKLQANLYQISIRSLLIAQIQRTGGLFFNQSVNLMISYLAAVSVVDGQLTIGEMMSIMFIIGQLSAPIEQIIQFVKSAQDATISVERINEIRNMEDEDYAKPKEIIPESLHDIKISELSFSYNYPEEPMVLKDLNVTLFKGKVNAIVGASGSGKTTLIKLLLGFYTPTAGKIMIEDLDLSTLNPHHWRSQVGAVLQDGMVFSNTIKENIALSETDVIDFNRVTYAAKIACIHEHIESLPLKYDTRIGREGSGLSKGQIQRILIARMVYKNPNYIVLDEATNSLDASNEKQIISNLKNFYQGKTTIIVAHRLSTVKDADNIIVMEHGEIVEQGLHKELIGQKGYYYSLVKNQLELGN